MPTHPRNHVVREGEIATYHTWSRCVQRAYLCGFDPLTGINFDYRREWIEELLKYLASVFAVDVGNYHILSNHEHAILRTRPDIAAGWSDEEVAWRWKSAWPQFNGKIWIAQPTDEAIRELLILPQRIAAARRNLASLSWFMARWKEPIARLANAETNRRGHFYEQRFGCRELEGDGAVLTCSIYLDLNQLKAGMADSLAASDYSAIQLRIRQWQREQAEASVQQFEGKRKQTHLQLEVADVEQLLAGCFLAPITDQGPLLLVNDSSRGPIRIPPVSIERSVLQETPGEAAAETAQPIASSQPITSLSEPLPTSTAVTERCTEAAVEAAQDAAPLPASGAQPATSEEQPGAAQAERRRGRAQRPATYEIHQRYRQRQRRRASDHTILAISPERYLQLAEWAAEQLRGKRSDTPPTELAGVLSGLGIKPERWSSAVQQFERLFGHAIGPAAELAAFCQRAAQRTLRGIRACRDVFT